MHHLTDRLPWSLNITDCRKRVSKSLAILSCCLLLFILSASANPVAAARYKLRQQGDNNDCLCCTSSDESARSPMRSPPSAMPPGCFQRLGAIGLMCRMEEQSSPVLDIWAVTRESQGVFLLRVSQSQVDAVQPEGRVAGTADDYVKVCVRENREIEVSMGPGPDGKIHNVNLRGSVHGPVFGTWDTYAGLSTMQKTVLPDAIRQPPTVGPQAPRPDGSVVHVVKQDETLFLIASAYGVTLQDLIERNNLADSNHVFVGQKLLIRRAPRQLPTVSPQDPRQDGSLVHVVRHGETLFAISYTYNVRMQGIIERNDLADGDQLRPGQELLIRDAPPRLATVSPQDPRPDGSLVHVVRHGETLFAISYTYNVRMQGIIERNDLADGDLLRPGQELLIRDAP